MMTNKPSPDDLVKRRTGAKTFNFPSKVTDDKETLIKGSEIEGEVVDREVTQQTDPDNDYEKLFWDDEKTKPKWQLVITLQTSLKDGPDDDGKRRIFGKYKLLDAIQDAVEKVQEKDPNVTGVEVGGFLKVVHDAIIPPEKKHRSPTKLFSATYTSAADRLVQRGGTPKEEPKEEAQAETPKADATSGAVDPVAAAAAIAALPPEVRKALNL